MLVGAFKVEIGDAVRAAVLAVAQHEGMGGTGIEPHVENVEHLVIGFRVDDAAQVAHYEPVVAKMRADFGRTPFADFARSYRRWTTDEMSDHLPIWVELETDYSDDYLMRYVIPGTV